MPLLEAVPNFSEGRDPTFLREVTTAMEAEGVEVLDASADRDHHRSVVTLVGTAARVEAAILASARVAVARIDLRRHRGVHPRIGALDVAPFVPLLDTPMAEAVASARRVAEGIEAMGVPVYLYGRAAAAGAPGLGVLRRGGFEALASGFPEERRPHYPAGRRSAHPTAGVSCVGARPLLLAWNLVVEGVTRDALATLARDLREANGGLPGVRALALELPEAGWSQLSMNLEGVEERDPAAVFEVAEAGIEALGGRVAATEVIGMIPDTLVLRTAARRLGLLDAHPGRLLSARLARHLAHRGSSDLERVTSWVRSRGADVPISVQRAAERLAPPSTTTPIPGDPE